MSNWIHTYKPGSIGSQDTITGSKPGSKIAGAITEIQEKCITEITDSIRVGVWTIWFTVNSGKIEVTADYTEESSEESGAGGEEGAGLPDGGTQYQVLQRGANGAALWDWVRAH